MLQSPNLWFPYLLHLSQILLHEGRVAQIGVDTGGMHHAPQLSVPGAYSIKETAQYFAICQRTGIDLEGLDTLAQRLEVGQLIPQGRVNVTGLQIVAPLLRRREALASHQHQFAGSEVDEFVRNLQPDSASASCHDIDALIRNA